MRLCDDELGLLENKMKLVELEMGKTSPSAETSICETDVDGILNDDFMGKEDPAVSRTTEIDREDVETQEPDLVEVKKTVSEETQLKQSEEFKVSELEPSIANDPFEHQNEEVPPCSKDYVSPVRDISVIDENTILMLPKIPETEVTTEEECENREEPKDPAVSHGNEDEILYILHRRHLVSTGEQTDESLLGEIRYASLPLSFVRSRSPNRPLNVTTLTKEQQRAQMEKVRSTLSSMAVAPIRSPKSPGDKRRAFDFVIYNKLPPKDSFSSKDDSLSPSSLERELVAYKRAKSEQMGSARSGELLTENLEEDEETGSESESEPGGDGDGSVPVVPEMEDDVDRILSECGQDWNENCSNSSSISGVFPDDMPEDENDPLEDESATAIDVSEESAESKVQLESRKRDSTEMVWIENVEAVKKIDLIRHEAHKPIVTSELTGCSELRYAKDTELVDKIKTDSITQGGMVEIEELKPKTELVCSEKLKAETPVTETEKASSELKYAEQNVESEKARDELGDEKIVVETGVASSEDSGNVIEKEVVCSNVSKDEEPISKIELVCQGESEGANTVVLKESMSQSPDGVAKTVEVTEVVSHGGLQRDPGIIRCEESVSEIEKYDEVKAVEPAKLGMIEEESAQVELPEEFPPLPELSGSSEDSKETVSMDTTDELDDVCKFTCIPKMMRRQSSDDAYPPPPPPPWIPEEEIVVEDNETLPLPDILLPLSSSDAQFESITPPTICITEEPENSAAQFEEIKVAPLAVGLIDTPPPSESDVKELMNESINNEDPCYTPPLPESTIKDLVDAEVSDKILSPPYSATNEESLVTLPPAEELRTILPSSQPTAKEDSTDVPPPPNLSQLFTKEDSMEALPPPDLGEVPLPPQPNAKDGSIEVEVPPPPQPIAKEGSTEVPPPPDVNEIPPPPQPITKEVLMEVPPPPDIDEGPPPPQPITKGGSMEVPPPPDLDKVPPPSQAIAKEGSTEVPPSPDVNEIPLPPQPITEEDSFHLEVQWKFRLLLT